MVFFCSGKFLFNRVLEVSSFQLFQSAPPTDTIWTFVYRGGWVESMLFFQPAPPTNTRGTAVHSFLIFSTHTSHTPQGEFKSNMLTCVDMIRIWHWRWWRGKSLIMWPPPTPCYQGFSQPPQTLSHFSWFSPGFCSLSHNILIMCFLPVWHV